MTKWFCDKCKKEVDEFVNVSFDCRGLLRLQNRKLTEANCDYSSDGFGRIIEIKAELCASCAAELAIPLMNGNVIQNNE